MISINIAESIRGIANIIILSFKFIVGNIYNLTFRPKIVTANYNGYIWKWEWVLNKDFKFEATNIEQVCNNNHNAIGMIEFSNEDLLVKYRECPICGYKVKNNDYLNSFSSIGNLGRNNSLDEKSNMISLLFIKKQIENDFLK